MLVLYIYINYKTNIINPDIFFHLHQKYAKKGGTVETVPNRYRTV